MAGVRAEILAASRSRTGWLEHNIVEEEQHLGTGNKPPFIETIKSTFEERDGSVPNSPTRMEPVRKLGSKVSTIANMFQALSPQKEEKSMISAKTANAKLKYMQENAVVKSDSGDSINLTQQIATQPSQQQHPPPPPPPPHTGMVPTKISSLSRTESHVARFNNAKAMFENLEARKVKQPMSLSSPKKIPTLNNKAVSSIESGVPLSKRESPPPPPPPPHAHNKNRAAAIEEARTLIQPSVVDGNQPPQPIRTTSSSPRGSIHEIVPSPRGSIHEPPIPSPRVSLHENTAPCGPRVSSLVENSTLQSPRVSLHEESVNKNKIENVTDSQLLNRTNQNVALPRIDAQKTYKDTLNRASSNQTKENSNLDKPDLPQQQSAIEKTTSAVPLANRVAESKRASTDLSLNLVVENGGGNHRTSSDDFEETPESKSPSPIRKRDSSSNSEEFTAYESKYVKHNPSSVIKDYAVAGGGGQNTLMNFDDKENRSITPEYNDNWQEESDVGRIKNFYGRTSASDNLRDSGGETLAEFESRDQELFLVEAVLGSNAQNGQTRKDTFLGSPVDDVELMTQEEADQLLSKRTRKSLLSDDEAQEVEYLLSQDACSSNRDSTVNSYSDASEDGASEALAHSQTVEACLVHDDVEYHVFPDGHYFIETPGLPPEDSDEDNMFFCTIPPKKKNKVQFSTAPIKMYSTHSVEDYDRHNDDVDPVSASAEYELEKRIENMDVFPVEILKGPEGLGLSIIGMGVGADAGLEKLGIFIKTITDSGAAAKDGRIKVNDQIIEVDGKSLVGVTQAYAASVLRSTSGLVRFLIGRDKEGPNSEIAQLISLSLQADKEQQDQSQNSQSDEVTRNYVVSPCETSVEDDDDQKSTDSSQNSVQDEGDGHIGHSDSYDLIAASTCSDSASTSDDPEILRAKLKEWQFKYAVVEAELKQLKSKSEADQSEWLKQLEFLKGKLTETESTLQNARQDILGCQQHVQDTEEQCIMLQKKYRKAKKIIKEYQKREQELIEQHDSQVQQILEKDKEYNDLVKALKERISLLETSIVDLQKQIGLPISLPFDHTARIFNNVSKKSSTYQKMALSARGTKRLDLEVSDSETSDNDSGKYEGSPESDDVGPKKFSTLERRKRNEEFLNKAVPQTELLDTSAAKSKAELATKGSLANRQPPTLKKQCSSNSIDEMVGEESSQVEEVSNKTYIEHHEDLPPPTPIVDYSPQDNEDPAISFRSSWTSGPNPAPPRVTSKISHPDPAINELYAYPKKIPKASKEECNENEKDDSTEKDMSARSSIIETTSRSTLSLDVGASGGIVKEPQHHSVTTTTLTATVSAVGSPVSNNNNNPNAVAAAAVSGHKSASTRQYVRPQHLGSFTPGSRDTYVSFTDELVRKVIQKFAQSSDKNSATGGGCYFNDETRKSLGLGLSSPTESVVGSSKRVSYNGGGGSLGGYCGAKQAVIRNGQAAEDDGGKGAQYNYHHHSESLSRKSESSSIQSPRGSEASPIGGQPLAFWQASPAHEWAPEHVGQWMMSFGLDRYVPQFIQSNISGQILIQLDSARLKNLGVVNGADRTLLKKKIKEMRSQIDRERKAHEREIKAKEKQLKKADKKKK